MFTEEKTHTESDWRVFLWSLSEETELLSVSPVKEFQYLTFKMLYKGSAVTYWPNCNPDDGADVKIVFDNYFFREKALIQ